MSDLTPPIEVNQKNILPGQLLHEFSYQGEENHAAYMRYLQADKDEAVWFARPEIMDF